MTLYQESHREFQDRFDSRRLADRIEERLIGDALDADAQALIQSLDYFFISTVDERGYPTTSYKGGARGFVRILDNRTLAFPSYNGNGMFLTAGNVAGHAKVGLLFISFEDPDRLRVHGTASIDPKDPLLANYPEAEFIVRVRVDEVFPNCPRYIHTMERKKDSEFVPQSGKKTPVPGWKSMDWAKDVLPKR